MALKQAAILETDELCLRESATGPFFSKHIFVNTLYVVSLMVQKAFFHAFLTMGKKNTMGENLPGIGGEGGIPAPDCSRSPF